MIIIADTGAIISLGHVNKIDLIEKVFGECFIAHAVWDELMNYEHPDLKVEIFDKLKEKVVKIKSKNNLSIIMDYGESESVILYEELQADYFLIDDNKARVVAESLNVNCIGSLGLLIKAKQKGYIKELKPIFEKWLSSGRYFSYDLLNKILLNFGETELKNE